MLFTVTFYETNAVAPSWSGVTDSANTILTYSEVRNSMKFQQVIPSLAKIVQ